MARKPRIEQGVESVVGFFTGNRKKELSEAEQKKLAADIRKESQNLKNCLEQITFRDPGNKIPTELLREQQLQVMHLVRILDNAMTTCVLDTREIDKKMVKLTDRLQEAYRQGNEETSKYIVMTLCYGVGKCHKPLLKDEEERIDEILKERNRRMDSYIMICKQAIEMDEEVQSIDKHTKKLRDLFEKRKAKKKETLEFRSTHPTAAKQVYGAGGHTKDLKGDAMTLAAMMREVTQTHYSMEQAKKEIGMCKANLSTMAATIDKIIINLNNHTMSIKEELSEFIKDMTQEEIVRITENLEWITNFDEALNGLYAATEAAFKTPDLKDYFNKAVDEFERVLEEMEEEEQEAASGGMTHEPVTIDPMML